MTVVGVTMDTTKPVVLVLADISGYTRFMLTNATAMVHAQMVVTKLLEEIIQEVEIPLQVQGVEGDAVFLYAVRPKDEAAWTETRSAIGRNLPNLFAAFSRGVLAGSEFALCSCPSCQNVDQLRLKVVVHCGEAVFHNVGRFPDLAGVDVILAHRLLKNSIQSDEYILMTEAAHREIEVETWGHVTEGEEHCEGFGAVRTYLYLPEESATTKATAVERLYENRAKAFATGLRMLAKGYLGQLQVLVRPGPTRSYRNLGELPVRPLDRVVMFLRVVLLAPLLIPIGAGVQGYRALTRSARDRRAPRA